ncbi:MAG: aminotransferase class III-fold pyridoxal phosphate-dependent enzyme [Candidatus Omnitrophica bacterium]|nr:aminotransferase class III-fold pyridoxal phosphate-dependent enzyme [Candidatus Omnitrophota bacterium]
MKNKGWEIFKNSLNYLGGGSSTNSKIPNFEEEPAILIKGKGCRVYDFEGNEYIDFRCALGPVTLGYNLPEINSAIIKQLENGVVFSYPHVLESEVAKKITEIIPCAERVRFLKTGGEAIAACIKIARNYTKRKKIIHCGYNGWLNCFDTGGISAPGILSSSPLKGIPPEISALHINLQWADFEKWERVFKEQGEEIAGVVIASDYKDIEKGKEFLPFIRDLTKKYGSLMIIDEIVTGFRVAIGGIQEYFNFLPDMAVFSKGIANGMPLSIYCGRKELIDSAKEIGISSTFGGETLSLAASNAVVEFYKKNNVIKYLWEIGQKMWSGVNNLFKQYEVEAELKGFPVCPFFDFKNPEERNLFFRKCFKNRVILYNVGYVCYSHKEKDINEALEKVEKSIKEMKNGSN